VRTASRAEATGRTLVFIRSLVPGRAPLAVGVASLSRRRAQAGNATVLNNAFSACRESRRVCCTTIGTLDSTTLA
jgi:hypothetical protein